MHLRHHPVLLMIIIREAISRVSKVSTDETKHFLICIMTFSLSAQKTGDDGRCRVHKMAFITVWTAVFVIVTT